jgi:flagellar biosynthetic protein FlhB
VAEESDVEKTESATPKRIEKAREEGQVARSRELTSFALLAAGFFGIWGLSGPISQHMQAILRGAFTFNHNTVLDTNQMLIGAAAAGKEGFMALLPVLALTGLAAICAPMALGGWLLSTKPMAPNFSRLNPISGLVTKPLSLALADAMHLLIVCCGMAIAGLFLVAALDVPYQLWTHAKKLRMTKEEVKREHRESDGDPAVKARIRAQQRAAARRRMMTAVPTADVIVTNPTHFAVALKYADGEMRAPKVVAKGVNLVATRIRELALEHNVPLLEAPPLARALYHNVDIDREIPGALYGAVAQVLAWVYQLRKFKKDGGTKPDEPENLEVPAELDKGSVPQAEADQEAADALAQEPPGNDPMKGSTA